MSKSLGKLIDQTIEVLRRDGWTVEVLEKTGPGWVGADPPAHLDAPIGAKCLFGAFNTAHHGNPYWHVGDEAREKFDAAVAEFIAALSFGTVWDAVKWNNAQTSAAPVIERLEAARR